METGRRKRLLILMKDGINKQQAQAITEGLEERLGVQVVVLSGATQALLVDGGRSDLPPGEAMTVDISGLDVDGPTNMAGTEYDVTLTLRLKITAQSTAEAALQVAGMVQEWAQ